MAPSRLRAAESTGRAAVFPQERPKQYGKTDGSHGPSGTPQACGGNRNHRFGGLSTGNVSARSSQRLALSAFSGHVQAVNHQQSCQGEAGGTGVQHKFGLRRGTSKTGQGRDSTFRGGRQVREDVGPENPAWKWLALDFSQRGRATRQRISAVFEERPWIRRRVVLSWRALKRPDLGTKDRRRRAMLHHCGFHQVIVLSKDELRDLSRPVQPRWKQKRQLAPFLADSAGQS